MGWLIVPVHRGPGDAWKKKKNLPFDKVISIKVEFQKKMDFDGLQSWF